MTILLTFLGDVMAGRDLEAHLRLLFSDGAVAESSKQVPWYCGHE